MQSNAGKELGTNKRERSSLFRDEITINSNARACEDRSQLYIDGSRARTLNSGSAFGEQTKRHSFRDEWPYPGQFSCAAVRVSSLAIFGAARPGFPTPNVWRGHGRPASRYRAKPPCSADQAGGPTESGSFSVRPPSPSSFFAVESSLAQTARQARA